MKTYRQFENGILVKEFIEGVEIFSNIGKKGATPKILPITFSKPKDYPTVAYSDWPFWAKAFSKLAKLEDKGIGDVVARTIGAENSEAFKKWYKATTGKDCGCTGRQNLWNIKYPLNLKVT